MDVFAHTLWANAGSGMLNHVRARGNKRPLSVAWTSFWGVFPDLFVFGIPSIISFMGLLQGSVVWGDFSHHGLPGVFDLLAELYNYTHSAIIWGTVFLATWAVIKRPPLELLGWILHILIDIPTHRINFYPTPFLFPISEYRFSYGISWSDTWFMILNYASLLVVFGTKLVRKKVRSNA